MAKKRQWHYNNSPPRITPQSCINAQPEPEEYNPTPRNETNYRDKSQRLMAGMIENHALEKARLHKNLREITAEIKRWLPEKCATEHRLIDATLSSVLTTNVTFFQFRSGQFLQTLRNFVMTGLGTLQRYEGYKVPTEHVRKVMKETGQIPFYGFLKAAGFPYDDPDYPARSRELYMARSDGGVKRGRSRKRRRDVAVAETTQEYFAKKRAAEEAAKTRQIDYGERLNHDAEASPATEDAAPTDPGGAVGDSD